MDMKVARAERLAMMGELSSARQVLESADLASRQQRCSQGFDPAKLAPGSAP